MTDEPIIPTSDADFEDESVSDPEVTGEPAFDPAAAGIPADTYITIRTSSGGTQYVLATEAMTVRDLIARSGLAIQGTYDVYMDQNIVAQDTLVPVGATVTLIGNVKGASL
jgi:hypothetical protein